MHVSRLTRTAPHRTWLYLNWRCDEVLSCPSGDSRSVVIVSSSGVGVPGNFGTANALTAMQSCFNVDSTVTTHRLVEVKKNYFIPPDYELHAPLPG
ncbi:hypothetical protein BHE74_00009051 [Ensete ventricosum]|nr:hypothetical protein BHE74_00009051 [Ensete ventricosum]